MIRFLMNLAVNVVVSVFVTGAWVLLFDAEPVPTFWYCMAGAYGYDVISTLLRSPK